MTWKEITFFFICDSDMMLMSVKIQIKMILSLSLLEIGNSKKLLNALKARLQFTFSLMFKMKLRAYSAFWMIVSFMSCSGTSKAVLLKCTFTEMTRDSHKAEFVKVKRTPGTEEGGTLIKNIFPLAAL